MAVCCGAIPSLPPLGVVASEAGDLQAVCVRMVWRCPGLAVWGGECRAVACTGVEDEVQCCCWHSVLVSAGLVVGVVEVCGEVGAVG